jgi:hypothetical protein
MVPELVLWSSKLIIIIKKIRSLENTQDLVYVLVKKIIKDRVATSPVSPGDSGFSVREAYHETRKQYDST